MSQTAMIILGLLVIFLATTAGSAIVWFFKRDISDKVNTLFLGFASGIMVAASVWSLIIPSIEGAESWGHKGTNEEEGPRSSLKKSTKMFLAVTIHNIPEGLAVGFAFGAAAAMGEYSAYVSALALAIGIAIQNFPEGAAVSLPMKTATGSRGKAFLYGMGSGAVEPVFAVVGYFLAANLMAAQPWFLAFAAGAMIFVVVEDLIPDAHLSEHPHFGTWGAMLGFDGVQCSALP